MSILLTGAGGFIGSSILNSSAFYGVGIIPFFRNKPSDNAYTAQEHILGDLSSPGKWMDQVNSLSPSCVIHMAGLTRSTDQDKLEASLLSGTEHLISALDGCSSHFILASSSAVYGQMKEGCKMISEEALCQPVSCYGEVKLQQEKLVTKLIDGSNLTILRFSNVIGPKMPLGYFVSDMIDKILNLRKKNIENPILNVSSSESSRDFIDVRDVSKAVHQCYELRLTGIYNVSSGIKSNLGQLVKRISNLIGYQCLYDFDEIREIEQCLSSDKLKKLCQWAPSYDINESLRDIISEFSDVK